MSGRIDVVGFRREDGRRDHRYGQKATYAAGSSYLGDTGPWIVGGEAPLPAGICIRVDRHAARVHVHGGKGEFKRDGRDRLAGHYGTFRY